MTTKSDDAEKEAYVDLLLETCNDLRDKIEPILQGKDPGAQGACLTVLTAKWFAGHHPSIRGEVMTDHFKCILDLVPGYEKVILRAFDGKWPVQQ